VTQKVLNRTATIGIAGPLDEVLAGIEHIGVIIRWRARGGMRRAPGATTSSFC
jgi:hypothetical protein